MGLISTSSTSMQRRRRMLFGRSSIREQTRNRSKKRKRRSAGELCVLQQSDNTQHDLPQTTQPEVDMDQSERQNEERNRLHSHEQARNCSRLRSIL
uniref:Uncharacterized protein n=1 Tax=Caenorhabditis japonica TaxID=281687 RepID=A0A8R1EG40_CAEJA